MITVKPYICPLCSTVQEVSTNHNGEIYSQCKYCKSSPLYLEKDEREFIYTNWRVKHYSFDLENKIDSEMYSLLKKKMELFNYRVFASYPVSYLQSKLTRKICSVGHLSVHEKDAFPDQFITQHGRLHNWKEWIFQNAKIKQGYYIERQEMRF